VLHSHCRKNLKSEFFLVGRNFKRSFVSDLWDTLTTFKVIVSEVFQDSHPAFVTTVRITQGRDNSRRFEVGLELPQASDETDVVEGRGKFSTRVAYLQAGKVSGYVRSDIPLPSTSRC
jgi:hypothetical protein